MYSEPPKGGKRQLQRVWTKIVRKIKGLNKRFLKRETLQSLTLKIALISVLFGVVPVSAHQSPAASVQLADLTLSKNELVFASADSQIKITPAESNAEIDQKRLAALSAQKSASFSVMTIEDAPTPSLDQMRQVYAEAGQKYGVPAPLIEAVHQVETGKSWDTARRSSGGAVGPMQFLPSTFRSYCVRTGEGCNITNAEQSIFAASLLLSANYNGSWDSAIMAYNHSRSYVARVKSIANELGANI